MVKDKQSAAAMVSHHEPIFESLRTQLVANGHGDKVKHFENLTVDSIGIVEDSDVIEKVDQYVNDKNS